MIKMTYLFYSDSNSSGDSLFYLRTTVKSWKKYKT